MGSTSHLTSLTSHLSSFNYRLVARTTGMMLIVLALGITLPIAVSLYTADGAQFALTLSAVTILTVGLFLRNILGRGAQYIIREKESIWLTVTIWVMIPLCGSIPYLFDAQLSTLNSHHFVNALFESFSGFTTTGSSVIARPEDLPAGLLVYRAMTQWIGGLGLLLFVVALLRKLGVGAGQLYAAEFSGTQQRKLHPHLAKSVTRLWNIYSLLTLALIALLLTQGTTLVDALSIAFSTVSTGGFVTHSAGVTHLGNGATAILVVFMFLSGINIALLYRFFTLQWKHLLRDEELRVYAIVFFLSVAFCTVSFLWAGNDPCTSLHYSLFHIASTMSTCGYYMPHISHWSLLVSVLTFVLIIIGASAGSTGGGLKLRRIIILAKYVGNYFTRMMHPNAVFRVKVNNQVVDDDHIHKIFAFVFLYLAFIVTGAFVLTLCGCSITDSVCMAAANVSNLGPSPLINGLGGSLDYTQLPQLGKITLIVLMLAGRLELFALVAVFSPSYWKK